MKYWRRHKHELEPDESGQPPAPLPEKKLRYSAGDDILLGRYFATRPQGTSDQIFQAFAKQVRLGIILRLGDVLMLWNSTRITLGRGGRSTIGFIKRLSTTMWR